MPTTSFGTTQLSAALTYGAYGATALPVSVFDDPSGFPVGSCVVIPDPTGGEQPFVGQVIATTTMPNTITLKTISTGTIPPTTTSLPKYSTVSFGGWPAGTNSGPLGGAFPRNVFWATDTTLIPAGASYGPATGDGTTDDSGAINNALSLAMSADGGVVMLPAGTFKCVETLTVAGSGVHLWGVGKDATIIMQGGTPDPGSYPAIVEVTGSHNSIQHLTVAGDGEGGGTNPGPITEVPVNPLDVNLGAGWGILCAGVTETHVQDVRVTNAYNAIGAIVFDTVRLQDIEVDGPTGFYGYYAQGPVGAKSSASMGLGGTAAVGDVVTITLTDDLGNSYTVVYTLVTGDTSLATLAGHLATAINNSPAVTGQTAFLGPVTNASTTLSFIALYGGQQGNTFTIDAAATGALTVSPTAFAGGDKESSNDFFASRCGCKPGTSDSTTIEAFHCDGSVSAFTTLLASTEHCLYHTRIATLNASTEVITANPPTFVEIQAAQSDHCDGTAFSFENGRSCRLIGSRSGATSGNSVYVGPSYGTDMRVLSCDFNSAITAVSLKAGEVLVEACSIAGSGTGVLFASVVPGQVSLVGNQFGIAGSGGQPTAIDLSAVAAGTDWITIVGNTLASGKLVLAGTPVVLGAHSRISNNPGINPIDPSVFSPTFPTGTTEVQNPCSCDAMVVITPHAETINVVKLRAPGGSAVTYLSGTFTGTNQIQVFVPCGSKISFTSTGSGATWQWFPT